MVRAHFPNSRARAQTYLYASLQAYARGERHSGIMEPIAAGLSLEEMRELARYYEGCRSQAIAPFSGSSAGD